MSGEVPGFRFLICLPASETLNYRHGRTEGATLNTKEPYYTDSLRLVHEASNALTKAVSAMTLAFPGPLHAEAIRLSIAVDELLDAMDNEGQ